MIRLVVAVLALASPSVAVAEAPSKHRAHVELDPLPFVQNGYGGQVGFRAAALPRLRFALASFSLDVPDFAAQLDDANDGFHVRVRPSTAIYVLYFLSSERAGWVAGGAVRYLRFEYTHDDFAGQDAQQGQFSVEAIGGYKWHPTDLGFYVQPWLGISRALAKRGSATVGDRTYEDAVLAPFVTVNLGWELEL